jgi:hypothetical protein
METREIFVMRERKYLAKWVRHKRVIKGTIEVYLGDEYLHGARYSDKYYFRRRIKELKEKHKDVWDRCHLIISPEVVDE